MTASLSSLILRDRDSMILQWEREVVVDVPALRRLPREEVIDHLPDMLPALAGWMESQPHPSKRGFPELAEAHATLRQSAAIEIQALCAEYATLRRVIVAHAERHLEPAAIAAGVRRLNAGLDLAVASSVHRYSAEREQVGEMFIAMLGHDLRDPLAVIRLSAATLTDAALPPSEATSVQRIVRAVRRMERMVQDVLDFARARVGTIPIVRGAMDMGAACREAVDESNAAARQPAELVTRGNLSGSWDLERVRQALSNLLRNARSHGTGPIRVEAWEDESGDRVFTSVTNEGPVIPEHLQPGLFEPYVRLHRDQREGIGIGLYIVAQIVAAHGGSYAVASSEARGTTFTLSWPR